MNETTLVWDVIYQILDECIKIELAESQRLIDQSNKKTCWSSELILINHQCYDFILNNARFHKLQVFYLLGQTTRQRDPVIIGVDNDKSTKNNEWTMLHISLSNQQRLLPDKQVCMFSFLEVRPPRKPASLLQLENNKTVATTTKRSNHRRYWYRQESSRIIMSGDGRVVPLFRYQHMIGDIEEFATLNAASIWVWRSPTSPWLYRNLPNYRLLLDNPENELLIWHHPSPSCQQRKGGEGLDQLSIAERVLHQNVSLFANLGSPATAAQFL
ncbi:hypothetical protein BDA99DRAFT_559074 [Phascolomyces articulosus]|uniref:Uncharacterized protein n=1 Tax=Phascolomyces articulosus TaxID=60185 RepID=A0AAD5KB24_9FUNG|nr:hypothetical protein BDA99DRAFT_559074 [Phascolomyces articulosus]